MDDNVVQALCQRSKDGAGHERPALHVTRLYVMANWRLNAISADHNGRAKFELLRARALPFAAKSSLHQKFG